MTIVVAIKQVPETDNVKMDPETGTMVRDGVEAIVNPRDLYAIELALQAREKHGGSVTALTMGPPSAEKALKEAIAMGCDGGVLLTDRGFAGSDTLATSYALSRAIKTMGRFDLVLAGERATDGDTGQVGPGLAAWLDIPVATYVAAIEEWGDSRVVVRRLVEDGYQRVQLALPALLTVVKEVANPRLPTLRGKKLSRQVKIPVLSAAELGVEPAAVGQRGSPTKVVKTQRPRVARKGTVLTATDDAGVDEAVARLIALLEGRHLL
ncbi:MAG TPA: electron transfer flavoprotein subunit beta/FixA family protein [Spirochaetia bacterium]